MHIGDDGDKMQGQDRTEDVLQTGHPQEEADPSSQTQPLLQAYFHL